MSLPDDPAEPMHFEPGGPKFGVAWTAIMRSPHISQADKGWYALLTTWNGDEGVWPSVNTLIKATGASRRGVQTALRRLEGLGLITAVTSKKGGEDSTRYLLAGPEWQAQLRLGEGANSSARGVRTQVRGGCELECAGGANPSAPKQTKEQTKEQNRAREVLAAFNETFGTKLRGDAWIKRIERRWPKGWKLEQWRLAIAGMDSRQGKDRYWEPRPPTPGNLIGRDGGELDAHYEIGKMAIEKKRQSHIRLVEDQEAREAEQQRHDAETERLRDEMGDDAPRSATELLEWLRRQQTG